MLFAVLLLALSTLIVPGTGGADGEAGGESEAAAAEAEGGHKEENKEGEHPEEKHEEGGSHRAMVMPSEAIF